MTLGLQQLEACRTRQSPCSACSRGFFWRRVRRKGGRISVFAVIAQLSLPGRCLRAGVVFAFVRVDPRAKCLG